METGPWARPSDGATEVEVTELLGALVRALHPDLVVETGCYTGHTTWAIATSLQRNGHGRLISLDVSEACVNITKKRCEGLPVEVLLQDSNDWEPPGPVDLFFIDGGEKERLSEPLRWAPFYHANTVIVVHDTEFYPWLGKALQALAEQGYCRAVFLKSRFGLAILQPLAKWSELSETSPQS